MQAFYSDFSNFSNSFLGGFFFVNSFSMAFGGGWFVGFFCLAKGLLSGVVVFFFFGGWVIFGFGVVGEADAGVVFEAGLAGDDDLVAWLDFGFGFNHKSVFEAGVDLDALYLAAGF